NGAVQSVNSVSTTVTQQGNTISAHGTQINTLTVTVNGVSAEISDVSSIVNGMDAKMSAYRSIKVAVDANGRQYIAGIGLDVSNSQAGMQSNIILLADRTTIMTNAGGIPVPIFTSQGDQAIINNLIVGKGTIGALNIADVLQSDNYSPEQAGLMINMRTGAIEINGFTQGEGRSTLTNERLRFLDANNIKRINLGKR
ncbi:DUF1983 domain-containing protein, partial [Pectobacterium polaris]